MQNGQAEPPRLAAVEARPLSTSHVAIAMAAPFIFSCKSRGDCGVISLYEAIVSVFRPQAIIVSY